MIEHSTPSTRRRDGFVMIAVLALLFVASALAIAWTTDALRSHRQARLRHMHRQVEWLAESALGRAAAALRADADYNGEQWRATPDQLNQSYAAAVSIRIESDPDGARRIVAEAVAPADSTPKARHTATRLAPVATQTLNTGDPSP